MRMLETYWVLIILMWRLKNLTGIKTNIIIDKIFDLFSSDAAMSNVYQKTEINSKEEIWIFLWFLKVQCSDITKYSPISNNAVAWHGAVFSD